MAGGFSPFVDAGLGHDPSKGGGRRRCRRAHGTVADLRAHSEGARQQSSGGRPRRPASRPLGDQMLAAVCRASALVPFTAPGERSRVWPSLRRVTLAQSRRR